MVTKSIKRGKKKSQNSIKKGRQTVLAPFGNKVDLNKLPAPLEKLRIRLSSPRLRSETTLRSYLETGLKFLNFLTDLREATPDDFRRYFIFRRQQEVSERTLRKEFYHLQKLAKANVWDWDFEREDVPTSYEPAYQPTLSVSAVSQLISCHKLYTRAEKFYLAVATTWGCRREELARILTRDIKDGVILLRIAKNHPPKQHLIPPVLKPLFSRYKPSIDDVSALSYLFKRICIKAGYERKERESFHSIRRIFSTELRRAIIKADLDESLQADFMAWTSEKKGRDFMKSPMAGVYDHKEVSYNDPFYYDTLVYPVHPFLPLWKGVTPDEPEVE